MHSYGHDPYRSVAIALSLEEAACRVEANAPAELRPVFEKIEGRMRFLGYPCKDIFAVKLALREAVLNAFRHGNKGDRSKKVTITYLVSPNEVLVEVQDQGKGFDPFRESAFLLRENANRPNGSGLFLMRAYSSWLTFNALGNCVLLCRFRSRS